MTTGSKHKLKTPRGGHLHFSTSSKAQVLVIIIQIQNHFALWQHRICLK